LKKRNKLKEEYKAIPGKEIAKLRNEGVEIQEEVKIPLFLFLGDTKIDVFENQDILKYPIIIVECTFIDPNHVDLATNSFHIHWIHLEPYIIDHPEITFILIHFSLRYRNSELVEFFKDKPSNVIPWISCVK